jgi:hypothetical protein
MMQSFVVSKAHNLIFQFWKEVEEEECRCIYVLLFTVLIDNTNHNDRMEHLIDIGIHIMHMVESATVNPATISFCLMVK